MKHYTIAMCLLLSSAVNKLNGWAKTHVSNLLAYLFSVC